MMGAGQLCCYFTSAAGWRQPTRRHHSCQLRHTAPPDSRTGYGGDSASLRADCGAGKATARPTNIRAHDWRPTVIDPFFLDRLMHAFTTAHTTPLSQPAEPAHRRGSDTNANVPSPPPRVVAEAAAVVAAALRAGPTTRAAIEATGDQA